MQIIKVENLILWNKKSSRLVTADGSDIVVEVVSKPTAGYGFLLAEQPANSTISIRWTVEGVSGRRINPNSTNQVVFSGSYLTLYPDSFSPKIADWKVYLYPVRVRGN